VVGTETCKYCGLATKKGGDCVWCSRKYTSNIKKLRKCGVTLLAAIGIVVFGMFGYSVCVNNLVWVAMACIVFLVTWYFDVKFADSRCNSGPYEKMASSACWIIFAKGLLFVIAIGLVVAYIGADSFIWNDSLIRYFYHNHLICILLMFSIPISIVVSVIKFFYMCIFSSSEDFEKFVIVLKDGIKKK